MEKLKKMINDLDLCDEMIVNALRLRFQIIQDLTDYKQEKGIHMVQPEEEQRKREMIDDKLKDYKYKTSVQRVFETILNSSKRIQSHELFDENIFLIGFMGVGKSTISRALQNAFDMEVVEMDEIIAQRNGMSISEIFDLHGEEYFRNEETNLLKECEHKKNCIVSCGGGVAMRQVNVDEMKKSGKIVLLTASPDTILHRVEGNHDRPLLENNKTVEYISELMEKRRPFYEAAADYIVHTDDKSSFEICEDIISQVSGKRI